MYLLFFEVKIEFLLSPAEHQFHSVSEIMAAYLKLLGPVRRGGFHLKRVLSLVRILEFENLSRLHHGQPYFLVCQVNLLGQHRGSR